MLNHFQNTRVLGKVYNLASYHQFACWHQMHNASYLKTHDDIAITATEVKLFLGILKPKKQASILDLCCGQGKHSQMLATLGYTNVNGLDKSSYLINRAKETSKKAKLHINYEEGDACKLPFKSDQFDITLILGNSFGCFKSNRETLIVLQQILRTLKPEGRLLLDLADGDYLRQQHVPGNFKWADKDRIICREDLLSNDQKYSMSRETITNTGKHVITNHPYTKKLYTRSSITQLLDAAGFDNIEIHEKPLSNKQETYHQMVSQRFIVTATVHNPNIINSKENVQSRDDTIDVRINAA